MMDENVVTRVLSASHGPTINPRDVRTWTVAVDVIEGVGTLSTVWNPVAFWPAGGEAPPPGVPRHHYQTALLPSWAVSETYPTEAEARAGHLRLRAQLRALSQP